MPRVGHLGALLVELHHQFDARRFLAARSRTPADYAAFLGSQLDDPDVVTEFFEAESVQARVDFVAPVEVTGYAADTASAILSLKDGRTLRAPVIVAADGAMSALRAMAGVGVISHDYKQSGIVTTIAHELPHEGVAYEHFLPAGPFASLPLSGNRSSLVWTESTEEAARLK